MAKAAFIKVQFVKDNAPYIDENVDEKKLAFAILTVQDLRIHPIIGTGIFDNIKTEIIAGSVSTFNPDNKTLLDDFIQPAMLWWIIAEFPMWFTYALTNKSVMKKSSDNSTPIDTGEQTRIEQRAKDTAEWYTKRIIEYLLENQADYPLYANPGSGVDVIHPLRKNYDVGMWLGIDSNVRSSYAERFQGNIDTNCL